jgi:hypothetical protein
MAIVFDILDGVCREDGGQSLTITLVRSDEDPDPTSSMSIDISSWDPEKVHPGIEEMVGKNIRVTVEVLGDAPRKKPSEMTGDEMTQQELLAELSRLQSLMALREEIPTPGVMGQLRNRLMGMKAALKRRPE